MAGIGYSRRIKHQSDYFIIKSGAELCVTFHLKQWSVSGEETRCGAELSLVHFLSRIFRPACSDRPDPSPWAGISASSGPGQWSLCWGEDYRWGCRNLCRPPAGRGCQLKHQPALCSRLSARGCLTVVWVAVRTDQLRLGAGYEKTGHSSHHQHHHWSLQHWLT